MSRNNNLHCGRILGEHDGLTYLCTRKPGHVPKCDSLAWRNLQSQLRRQERIAKRDAFILKAHSEWMRLPDFDNEIKHLNEMVKALTF